MVIYGYLYGSIWIYDDYPLAIKQTWLENHLWKFLARKITDFYSSFSTMFDYQRVNIKPSIDFRDFPTRHVSGQRCKDLGNLY